MDAYKKSLKKQGRGGRPGSSAAFVYMTPLKIQFNLLIEVPSRLDKNIWAVLSLKWKRKELSTVIAAWNAAEPNPSLTNPATF